MTDANGTPTEIPWGPLGREWWEAAGAQLHASDRQIAMAACLEASMTRTAAALLAGYTNDKDRARKVGSEVAMSKAVTQLRALARAEAEGDKPPSPSGDVSFAELRRTYSDLVRSSDPMVKLRAGEALAKLLQPEPRAAGPFSPAWDGNDVNRVARGFLRLKFGAAAYLLLRIGQCSPLSSLEMLHDLYQAVQRETPQVWDYILSRVSAVERAEVALQLADPNWQRAEREQVWREVGIDITAHPDPALIFSQQQQQPVAISGNGKSATNGAAAHADA